MKKIIFGLMMIMGVVMFTSCDPNAGSNDYIDDDETIVTPTEPIDDEPIDNPTNPVISNETLVFVENNYGYVVFEGASLSSGNNMWYNNVSNETEKMYDISVVVIDGVENRNIKFDESNDGVTMYIKNVESVTYTVTTVGTTTTTMFAVTTN